MDGMCASGRERRGNAGQLGAARADAPAASFRRNASKARGENLHDLEALKALTARVASSYRH
jgi:hypothetical protein